MDLQDSETTRPSPAARRTQSRGATAGWPRSLALLLALELAVGLSAGCATAPATAPPAPAAAPSGTTADSPAAATAETADCHRVESALFVFHSDPWINLHHFLFQWARGEAERQPGDRRHPVEVAERVELGDLDAAERQAWEGALRFYRERLVARDLLWDRGLVVLRDPLATIACAAGSPDDIAAELHELLPPAMTVYRRHWWPRHHAANRGWIEAVLVELKPYETVLGERLNEVYGGRGWPPESHLRVDVGAYANHTSAYTTNRPDQVTVTSTHPYHRGLNAVEVLFHEASHASYFEQPLLAQLDAAFDPHGLEPPDGLSHVIQFVTPTELLRSLLDDEQRRGFQPYAERVGLWRNPRWDRYRQVLERHWVPFLHGELERAQALERVAAELAAR